MTARAKQQLTAILLNVAAGYIHQTELISADGATVSQAITYSDNLIDDPAGDHEIARTICDEINNSQEIPTGVIPLATVNIVYKAVGSLPHSFALGANYPNPFNAGTVIPYSLAEDGLVHLTVFDVLGRTVASLVDDYRAAGQYRVVWDGTDGRGRALASGMYFYRLTAGDIAVTKRMVLLK
jgi:hypothetical protein